jgi:hypothetical protein
MLAFNIARSVKFLSILIANTLIMLYACALLQLVTVSMVDEIRFTYSTAKILTTSLSPLRNAANVFWKSHAPSLLISFPKAFGRIIVKKFQIFDDFLNSCPFWSRLKAMGTPNVLILSLDYFTE